MSSSEIVTKRRGTRQSQAKGVSSVLQRRSYIQAMYTEKTNFEWSQKARCGSYSLGDVLDGGTSDDTGVKEGKDGRKGK